MLAGNHYRGHDSAPSSAYLLDMRARVGGGAGEAPAKVDDPLAKAHDALAKMAVALGLKPEPEPEPEEVFLDPLAKATAAVESLQKAIADCEESFAKTRVEIASFGELRSVA